MPDRRSFSRVERHEVGRRVAGEEDVARRAEQPGANAAAAGPLVAPGDLAGAVVDRLQHRLGPAAAIVAAPSLRLLVVLVLVEVVHAEGTCGVGVEESSERTEAWR